MKAYRTEEIRIFVTPADLREIADRAEASWLEFVPGDDLTVGMIAGDGFQVVFVIAQERMPARAARRR